jgi:hypothetical protein
MFLTLRKSSRSTDPFDDPECEAEDVFVNELNCIGQGKHLCLPVIFQYRICLKMLDSQMANVNSNSGCLTWFWHFTGPAAGCPYSCVARAPDVFSFAANTGCARAVSQGEISFHVASCI